MFLSLKCITSVCSWMMCLVTFTDTKLVTFIHYVFSLDQLLLSSSVSVSSHVAAFKLGWSEHFWCFETLKWFLKFCFFAIVYWILVSTIFTIFILVSSEIFAKQWKNVGIWDRNFNYIGKKNCWFWEKNICILAVILKRENNWP